MLTTNIPWYILQWILLHANIKLVLQLFSTETHKEVHTSFFQMFLEAMGIEMFEGQLILSSDCFFYFSFHEECSVDCLEKIKQSGDFIKCSEKVVSLLPCLLDNKSWPVSCFHVAYQLVVTSLGRKPIVPPAISHCKLQSLTVQTAQVVLISSHQSQHPSADGDLQQEVVGFCSLLCP